MILEKLTVEATELTQLVIEKHRGNPVLAFKLITLVNKFCPWVQNQSNLYHDCADNLIKCLLGEDDLGILAPYLRTYLCKALLLDLHELMNMVDHNTPLVREVVLWRLSGQDELALEEGATKRDCPPTIDFLQESIEHWKKAEGFSGK
jgi:hypothetical protein